MIDKKAIICMAAGPSQVMVIKKAKEMGFKVIAVDRKPDAVGFELADEKIIISTYEPQPIINHILKLKQYKLMGVINRSSGPPVITSAVVSKAFDLPGIEPEIADNIVSKSKLSTICNEKNIAVPNCQSVQDLSEIVWDQIEYPCIVKPSLSLIGKSRVKIIRDKDDLTQAFQRSKKVSCDGWVNIEEYIAGHDISLMAMVRDGELLPVVLLDELNCRNDSMEFYGAGFVVPSIFSDSIEEKHILDLADDIVNKLGLRTTPFLMSCKCEKGGFPCLIEIHLDLGGDLVLDELLPASSSFDFIKYAIDILTGQIPEQSMAATFSPAAILYGKGECLVTERPFQLMTVDNRKHLEEKVRSRIILEHDPFASIAGGYK